MRIFRPSRFVWLIFGVFWLLQFSAGIHAQDAPTPSPTPTSTPTPTPAPHALTIFRDTDTFTLYAPAQAEISLIGFAFAVSDKTYALENYSAFLGLPFSRLPTPLCFRLIRSGASSPLPQDCVAALILTQTLSNADVFWYDAVLVQDFVVLIQRDGITQGICASGQSVCAIAFTPGEVTPTPTVSVTPTVSAALTGTPTSPVVLKTPTAITRAYPCEATVVYNRTGLLNIVRGGPSSRASFRPPIPQGAAIRILSKDRETEDIFWYHIVDANGNELGWIPTEYAVLSSNCPE